MRKFNSILSIIVLFVFLLHMTVSALLMIGVIPFIFVLQRTLSWMLILTVSAHIFIGIKLTYDTVSAIKRSGVSYPDGNLRFWTVRISGAAVLLFAALHIIIFSDKIYEPGRFGISLLALSLLLSLSVLVHIVCSIKPLMIGLGKAAHGKGLSVAVLILSVLLLASGAAFIVFYISMNL